MLRIQGRGGDPAEEKRKVREGVINSFISFGVLITMIRLGKFQLRLLSQSVAISASRSIFSQEHCSCLFILGVFTLFVFSMNDALLDCGTYY